MSMEVKQWPHKEDLVEIKVAGGEFIGEITWDEHMKSYVVTKEQLQRILDQAIQNKLVKV